MTEKEKQIAMKLLDEHSKLKGPADLEEYNIKVQTFLVFYAMKQICTGATVEELERGQ